MFSNLLTLPTAPLCQKNQNNNQKNKDEMYRSSENKKHQAYGSVREPVAKNWIWREKCLESCHSRPNLGLEGLASETPK